MCVLLILFYFMKTFQLPLPHLKTQMNNFAAQSPGSLSMRSERNYTSGLTDIRMSLDGEVFTSLITTPNTGWLGNQICGYASLMYFQKVHGMHAIMSDWQLNILAGVFQQEKFEIQPSTIKMPVQFSFNWEGIAEQVPEGAWFPKEDVLENIEEYKYNKFLDIGMSPNYLFLYKEVLEDIRGHLLFQPDLQALVDGWLADITQDNLSGKQILFIGVHCRRGEGMFAEHMMALSGATMVDHHYFDRAFDIYRSRYNNPTTEVIFLVVSDEPAWIKENLGKHEDVRFGIDFSQGIVKGNGSGFDLCLMAACNHSIHTYGTYGTWGSLLAGGDVIVPTGINAELNTEEDQIYKRAAMPGWVYLDVRDLDNIQEITYD
eukprot:GFUD01006845.1.p1 GENE.GFUD01006845.1~~GFUD01006845.1.p1  ORF type:complete len:394 (-),score=65.44 GFUD01006845.1:16-1137(-)